MSTTRKRKALAGVVRQLRAHAEYFQAAGLEEAGAPVRPTRTPKHANASAMGGGRERPVRAEQTADPGLALQTIRDDLGDCTRCRLHEGRTHLVYGAGNPRARLMFIGEAPGQDEDEQGLPFVGRAGQLLTKMIESMGLRRDDVYIANVIKCRPPGNRPPRPDEVATCEPFMRRQISSINPEVVCALGSSAAQAVLRRQDKISMIRGRFFLVDGVKVLPTYHPAYLLRSPGEKRVVWEDLQKIMAVLNKTP
jgi:DNA polymerase